MFKNLFQSHKHNNSAQTMARGDQCVDLHTHTDCSDGSLSPKALVEYAATKPLYAMAITDHDSIEGIAPAMEHAAKTSGAPKIIPGIELSTLYKGSDIHIIGLYIDYEDSYFLSRLREFVSCREQRNEKMCALLAKHGIRFSMDDLRAAFPDSIITRAHFARHMHSLGHVTTVQEAFDRYLGDDKPCFVPRAKISPSQAISLILDAGGVAVLAHPLKYKLPSGGLESMVAALSLAGLDAIEVYYPTHKESDRNMLSNLAKRFGLAKSGGSDFHGASKPGLDLANGYGDLWVPKDVLEPIKERAYITD